jgi:hypothetical protein
MNYEEEAEIAERAEAALKEAGGAEKREPLRKEVKEFVPRRGMAAAAAAALVMKKAAAAAR